MVISFPALVCLEATWRHILAHAGMKTVPSSESPSFAVADGGSRSSPAASLEAASAPDTGNLVLAAEAETAPGAPDIAAANGPLTAAERRARAAALRGLARGRARRFQAAEGAFTAAARLDPRLDLTRTPGFWSLERGAHEAAIAAYIAAGREGDAVLLQARVRITYRPRPLRTVKGALLHS